MATVANNGPKRLDDWELEIEFPTPLLDGTVYAVQVPERSNAERSLFRIVGARTKRQLRPGDKYPFGIGYFVDKDVFWNRNALFDEEVTARILIDGEVAGTVKKPIRELQKF